MAMNNINNTSDKRKKYLWYGWQKDAGHHFGVEARTIENYRRCKSKGLSIQMKRKQLIEWCKSKMAETKILTDDEIETKINEAFGEC